MWVMRGGAEALVCGGIGAALGFASGDNTAERAENMKWGAIFGILVGVVLGVVVIAPK